MLRINLVGRARRARRTIPCNPPYLIRLVRPHDPRRKKIVAYKPLQKRKMARVTSRRRLQQFVKRTRPQHLRAQLLARLGETWNIRQVFTACAYRIKFFATLLGFALRDLGFRTRVKRRVRAHIDFHRGPGTRLCKQLGQIPRVCAIQRICDSARRKIRRLAGGHQIVRLFAKRRCAMFARGLRRLFRLLCRAPIFGKDTFGV